jgi:hypothetical protein
MDIEEAQCKILSEVATVALSVADMSHFKKHFVYALLSYFDGQPKFFDIVVSSGLLLHLSDGKLARLLCDSDDDKYLRIWSQISPPRRAIVLLRWASQTDFKESNKRFTDLLLSERHVVQDCIANSEDVESPIVQFILANANPFWISMDYVVESWPMCKNDWSEVTFDPEHSPEKTKHLQRVFGNFYSRRFRAIALLLLRARLGPPAGTVPENPLSLIITDQYLIREIVHLTL